MVGAALGRLWDTHPKLAFVLHLLLTVYLGALAVWLFVTRATGLGAVLTIAFAVMAGSLVLFTWRYDGSMRDEVLANEDFDTVLEARIIVQQWRSRHITLAVHTAPMAC